MRLALPTDGQEAPNVSLRSREKQQLYHELGNLLRSGRALPGAIETMQDETRGALGRFLRRVGAALKEGATAGEAFTKSADIGELERSVVKAGERSGRLDQSCLYLSRHFAMMAGMQSTMLRRMAYPMFLLLLGVFLLNLKEIFTGGIDAYLRATLGSLFWILAIVAALWGGTVLLLRAGRVNRLVDWGLFRLPLLGKLRQCLTVARFCATYSMNLAAGINVIDSLLSAGEVSHSALLRQTSLNAVPALRGGAQLSPLLSGSSAIPRRVIRSIRLGEETGGMDEELARVTEDLQREGLTLVDVVSEWVPRLVMVGIMIYVGYQIIQVALGYFQMIDNLSQ